LGDLLSSDIEEVSGRWWIRRHVVVRLGGGATPEPRVRVGEGRVSQKKEKKQKRLRRASEIEVRASGWRR
jgi:hypothetical protein